MEIKIYTDKAYWEQYWNKEDRKNIDFYFADLLDQYIKWDELNSYMEIGGAPGSIMVFMNKCHKLQVATVDFSEKERIEEYLKYYGVSDYRIYQDDFMSFDIKSHKRKYGIVASWGFVEHFECKIIKEFIEKQKNMVADNGYLVIELPNIRKLMWLVYWIFNRERIKIHNLKAMDVSQLKKWILAGGKFELLYASYYFTMNKQNEYFLKHGIIKKICEKIAVFFREHKFNNKIKKYFFPYIVIIAKRVE